jgi:predicted phage terminase large subunit-like protein
MDSFRNLYVVEAKHGRWGVDKLIAEVFQTYHTWKPAATGLETVMFQKALLWPFREAMRREHTNLNITELRPSSRVTKEARIVSLQDSVENGSLWIREGLEDLIKEMQEFPVGSHDDLLDALAYSVQMCTPAGTLVYEDKNPFKLDNILLELKMKSVKTNNFWSYHQPYTVH